MTNYDLEMNDKNISPSGKTVLVIDNYDSFTYNIVQYFGELDQEVKVVRNDQVTLEDIERWQPKYLVIGPGPCSPTEAGISIPAINHFAGKIPVLGVCLGHQAIGQAFGGNIIRAKTVMQKQGIYKFDCTVHVEDELAASAQIMIARQGQ